MIRKRFYFKMVCIGLLLLISSWRTAPLLYAQSSSGKLDPISTELSLAEKLVEKYPYNAAYDLAEELCNKILKNAPSNNEIKARIAYTLVTIKRKKINLRGLDPELLPTYIDEAITALEQFAETYKDDPRAIDAKFEAGDLLRDKATTLTKLSQREKNPTKKSVFRDQAEVAFSRTETYFKSLAEQYGVRVDKLSAEITDEYNKESPNESKIKELENEREKADEKLAQSEFFQGTSLYNHALLYGAGTEARQKLLNTAIKLFEDFIFRGGASNWTYQACNESGLCYLELGDYDNALKKFETASKGVMELLKEMEKLIGPGPEDIKREDVEATRESFHEIIERGFALTAQTYNRMGEYQKALKTIEEMVRTFPAINLEKQKDRVKKDEFALMGIIEQARSLFYLNDVQKALRILNDVVGLKGKMVYEARTLRQTLLKGLGPAALTYVPPKDTLTSLRILVRVREIDEAINQSKEFLSILRQAPVEIQQEYIPLILVVLGDAYRNAKPTRLYEAVVVFEEIYKRYPNAKDEDGDRIIKDALSNASACYSRLYDETKDKSWKERIDDANKTRIKEGLADDLEAARAAEQEGDYLKSAELYKKIQPSHLLYLFSQEKVGQMYYFYITKNLWPDFEKQQDQTKKTEIKNKSVEYLSLAEKQEKTFIEYITSNTTKDNEKKMKNYEAMCHVRLARIHRHPANQNYPEMLKVLDGFENKYKSTRPDIISEALQYKIEAFIKTKNLNQAESFLKILLDEWINKYKLDLPKGSILSVAEEYEKMAGDIISYDLSLDARAKEIEALKNKDKARYDRFLIYSEKYAKYYWEWLVNLKSTSVEPDHALAVADKMFRAAQDLPAAVAKSDLYTKASNTYTNILNNAYSGKGLKNNEDIWKVRLKTAWCLIELDKQDEALSLLLAVEKELPNNLTIKTDIALAYMKRKKWEKAIEKWREISVKWPESTEEWWNARYNIILCYKNIGASGGYQIAQKELKKIKLNTEGKYDGGKYKELFETLDKELSQLEPGGE